MRKPAMLALLLSSVGCSHATDDEILSQPPANEETLQADIGTTVTFRRVWFVPDDDREFEYTIDFAKNTLQGTSRSWDDEAENAVENQILTPIALPATVANSLRGSLAGTTLTTLTDAQCAILEARSRMVAVDGNFFALDHAGKRFSNHPFACAVVAPTGGLINALNNAFDAAVADQ